MGLFDKLKDRLDSNPTSSVHFPSTGPGPPLGSDSVDRYRKQRGLNLGSWFVLERWISAHPFRNAASPGQSDHDVAKGKDAKAVLEEHWDSWIKEEDWVWIKEKGFNSVRIPVAYYHVCGPCPEVLAGTDFEPYANVFVGAWQRIEAAIQTAGNHGIGVLIDLHCAAGAQNADSHSGLSTGKPNLFNRSANLRSTSLALRFLASKLAPIPHIVGLELLNEPANDNRLQGWYEKTLNEIRAITGPDFPIYVHDAWDTQHYALWTGQRGDFVVLDHHLYRAFDDGDRALAGEQHAQKIRQEFSDPFTGQCQAAQGCLVVAEWSAGLDDWGKGMPDGERDRNKREFVKAQLELFEKCTAGWWFWTYKKGDGWDAGWSSKDAMRAEVLPAWVGSRPFKGVPPQHVKDAELQQAHNSHTSYWQANGGSPNPAVYAPGFSQGWDDALIFLGDTRGVSELGFTSKWIARRKVEFEAKGQVLGNAAWEWEHGFKQGVESCQRVALG